jgi:hypothetical protein
MSDTSQEKLLYSSALIGYSIEMDFRRVIPFMFRKNGAAQEAVEEGLNFSVTT